MEGVTPVKKPSVTATAATMTRMEGRERVCMEETMIVMGRLRPRAIWKRVVRKMNRSYTTACLEKGGLYVSETQGVENETDDVNSDYWDKFLGHGHLDFWYYNLWGE